MAIPFSPGPMDKMLADKVLEDFDDLCKSLELRYCLVGGTSLGFYRDGGFILWDDDMDVWIDCDPVKDGRFYVMLDRLVELGFTFFSDNHRFCRDNTWLDIWKGDYREGVLPFLESFDAVVYNGRTYNLPHPIEGYLEYKYGDWRTPRDWRIPREEW